MAPEARTANPVRWLRGGLLRRYALLITALMAMLLVATGALTLGDAWRRSLDYVRALRAEQAQGAAARIELYMASIERQLGWPGLAGMTPGGDLLESKRIEYLKLLRQVPAITEAAWIDPQGREQLRVSRLHMDARGEGLDRSAEAGFKEASAGRIWRSAVSFRKQTEPYISIAQRAGHDGGVIAVEVNLKFAWDVVAQIHPGGDGIAFVVDGSGALIAHPDISLVLKQTSLSALPQIAAALDAARGAPNGSAVASANAVRTGVGGDDARDLAGQPVLSAWAALEPLGWYVFVESPRAQALAPVWRNVQRVALVLGLGLLVAALASAALARRLVQPIRALRDGTRRIAAGELDHRVEARGGDELRALAGDFNRMAEDLRASYSGLERKVQERTAALSTALAHQAASTEVLQVIARSVSDAQPVYDAILGACDQLFEAFHIGIMLIGDDAKVHLAAHGGEVPDRAAFEAAFPFPADSDSATLVACTQRRVLHFGDVVHDEDVLPRVRSACALTSSRSILIAPLLWQMSGIGAIFVARRAAGRFSDAEVELIKTFADQAAIAIQNARLFRETQEALAQQTATADVLRVISGSMADEQPVFDKILISTCELFASDEAAIFIAPGDGLLHRVAATGRWAASALPAYPRLVGETSAAVVIEQRRQIHYRDVADPSADVPLSLREAARAFGGFSIVLTPLLRRGEAIGMVAVARPPGATFTEKELAVLRTFADQAVIAIRNTRLVRELEDKSRQLEIASRHKSEFLANMSHELRTPLNAVIGFSEVLIEQMFGEVNDKQLEYLRDIHSSGQHLLTLINDVLDLSKIEAGRMELELSRVNLAELLEQALALVRERAQRQRLTLELHAAPDVGEWVVDARKVKQVVLNLLSNAVKFTPSGGRVAVGVRCARGAGMRDEGLGEDGADDDRMMEVSVSDTGVGIASQEHERIFEAFRQAEGDYLRKAEGTGLGLPLARRFVELHGGTIRLTSCPGAGSTFTFTLPRREGGD